MKNLFYKIIFLLCASILNSCVSNDTGDLTVSIELDKSDSLIVTLYHNKQVLGLYFSDEANSTHVFKNIPFGCYNIRISPNQESIDGECIYYKRVELMNPNQTVSISIPRKTVDLTINFDINNLSEKKTSFAGRLEKVDSTGVDKIYKQWVYLVKTKEGFCGRILYVSKGKYKLTINEPIVVIIYSHAYKRIVTYTTYFTIDGKILEKGKIKLKMKNPVGSKNSIKKNDPVECRNRNHKKKTDDSSKAKEGSRDLSTF